MSIRQTNNSGQYPNYGSIQKNDQQQTNETSSSGFKKFLNTLCCCFRPSSAEYDQIPEVDTLEQSEIKENLNSELESIFAITEALLSGSSSATHEEMCDAICKATDGQANVKINPEAMSYVSSDERIKFMQGRKKEVNTGVQISRESMEMEMEMASQAAMIAVAGKGQGIDSGLLNDLIQSRSGGQLSFRDGVNHPIADSGAATSKQDD